jgi:hypothetical protein
MIGFTRTSVTNSLNYSQYSAIADLHTFQFTVAHALGFSVSTNRPMATDLKIETGTSIFLPFLVPSPWNLGTQLKLFLAESESESESRLLYDWRFTANQFVLAPSPLRLMARIFFQLNTCGHSPNITSSLTRGWVYLL